MIVIVASTRPTPSVDAIQSADNLADLGPVAESDHVRIISHPDHPPNAAALPGSVEAFSFPAPDSSSLSQDLNYDG